jgi:hypothetical protein
MAIALSKVLFSVALVCYSFGLLTPHLLLAGNEARWSYDSYDSKDPKPSSQPTFNPWTGDRSGPLAATPGGQFHYDDDSRYKSPPSLDDLYPKPGVQPNGQRPWGKVPSEFKEPDRDSFSRYGQREEFGGQNRWWPERKTRNDPWLRSYRGGQVSTQTQEWPDLAGQNREWPDDRPQYRGYGDRYRSPYGPLFNDNGSGHGGWQGDNRFYRNFNSLPR